MSAAVTGAEPRSGRRLSVAAARRAPLVAACAAITGEIRPGLDLRGEIDAVLDQRIGRQRDRLRQVRPGPGAAATFAALLAACRGYAARIGAHRLVLGVGTARHLALTLVRENYRWGDHFHARPRVARAAPAAWAA